MLIALDHNNNRVHISQSHSNQEYYCPSCGAPLITKKGEERIHHFAHKAGHICKDSWETTRSYDTSPWHVDWQQLFPKDNQEISLKLGNICHRADVIIGRTVVEFQHSIISTKKFEDRNNYYHNLGYKVVWLFDMSELFESGDIYYEKTDHGLLVKWNNPRKAFKEHAFKDDNIDLFFQICNDDSDCIIRILNTSENGFEEFETSDCINKSEFLLYVGLVDGFCEKPALDILVLNYDYNEFKNKFGITLDHQQERALQSVEGANLLIAVPGAGKTTVLVDRLGYMIINRGISPEDILAITFNKHAADEMKDRFSAKFGKELGERIHFQTINALAFSIYRFSENQNGRYPKHVTEARKHYIIRILQSINNRYPYESEIQETGSAISYIKNMCLSDSQIKEMNESIPNISDIFYRYQAILWDANEMDFDDQLIFARQCLLENFDILQNERDKYKYICVDEAQDTSKIQHEIIKLLAEGKNIFMVGDEDQSIYGFRAAFPQALLNFRYDYRNPYIMRMETNYRSTPEIVDIAQRFISKNKGRYNKTMTAVRPNGNPVTLQRFATREEQYNYLLGIALNNTSQCAFLYRNNESSVVLIDMLLRNGVKYNLRKPEADVFGNRVTKDILAYLSFALDTNDTDSLRQIINKGILYLTNTQTYIAIKNYEKGSGSLHDELEAQMVYNRGGNHKDRVSRFYGFIEAIQTKTTEDAINYILESGYSGYLSEKGLDVNKVDTLLMLAKKEPDIKGFLERITYLKDILGQDAVLSTDNSLTLSTIHSSKGKEYDTVYLIDVYDGYFPSSRSNTFNQAKDNSNGEQEERRMLYVGLTRAKNDLIICNIDDHPSSYIDELFPEIRCVRQVENSIASIGEVIIDSEWAINNAKHRYEKLSDFAKSQVRNRNVLLKAESDLIIVIEEKRKREELAASIAVKDAEDAISAIGDVTIEKRSLIESAISLYKKIPGQYKSNTRNYEKLRSAVDRFNELINTEEMRKEEERIRKRMLRVCSICHKEKPLSSFSTASYDSEPICNECVLQGGLNKECISRIVYCPKCHTMLLRNNRSLSCRSLYKCGWHSSKDELECRQLSF